MEESLGQQEKLASRPDLSLGFYSGVLLNKTVSEWLGPNFHSINKMNRSRARTVGDPNV